MLTDQEFVRYSRQIMLPECGEAGQLTLRNARVLLLGVGGLGCASAAALAAAGVGYLRLCDNDTVELSNLPRQLLFNTADIGKLKVAVAQRALIRLNPYIQIDACPERFAADSAANLLNGIDWVLDGTDNFASRLLISQHCQQRQINLLTAALSPRYGQLMLWPYRQQDTPAYHQLFSTVTDSAGNCRSQGVLGPFAAMVGQWQASMLVQQLLKPTEQAALWQLDTISWQIQHIAL